MDGSIIVGIDDSLDAALALDWAIAEARHRGAPLRLVHARQALWPAAGPALTPYGGRMPSMATDAAGALTALAEKVGAEHADLDVSGELVDGDPVHVLLDAAKGARLVVVGTRARGALVEALTGSVAHSVAGRAECPVTVVAHPAPVPSRHVVVVGVDAGAPNEAAIGVAFDYASRYFADLRAVHAWGGPGLGAHSSAGDIGAERRLLAEALAGWSEKYPDVTLTPEPVRAPALSALTDAARRADLLVIGASRPHFGAHALGPVARPLLRRSVCPVLVVPADLGE